MKQEMITASSLCVRFDQHTVLDQVNFTVRQGEVFALLGGNGAGKSTVLKAFIGTILPSSGSAIVMGMSVPTDLDSIRSKVAYLPESVMLYGHLTGVENIKYFLSLACIKKSELEIEQALQRVVLQKNAWHTAMSNYSKGMRQKNSDSTRFASRCHPYCFLMSPHQD